MSEKKRTVALVIVSVKNLLLAVERRSNAISGCCPSLLCDDEDEVAKLRKVSVCQTEVEDAIQQLRAATDDRLKPFSNAEVAIIAHLWSSIWASDSCLSLNSTDLDRLGGRNQPEEIEALIKALLGGTSPLFGFISMVWAPHNRGGGNYSLSITNVNRLHRLLLGDIQIA